jgi:hypothetical protein
MAQTCRICGADVRSGFTNCDSCYNASDKTETKEIKFLKPVSKAGKLGQALFEAGSR